MRLGDIFNNRQPQAGAAVRARPSFIHPVEAIPDARQMFSRNAGAAIDHRKLSLIVYAAQPNVNDRTRRGVLGRILQQIPQQLRQTLLIALDDDQLVEETLAVAARHQRAPAAAGR